jgi:hypothetical protein
MQESKQKKTEGQKFEDWVKRTAKQHAKSGGDKRTILLKERGQNPLTEAFNVALKEERRRRVN